MDATLCANIYYDVITDVITGDRMVARMEHVFSMK